MEAKTKKAAKKKNRPVKKAGAKAGPRQIQIWRTDLVQAARLGLCYTLKDLMAASGVSEMVVMRIIRGNPDVQYRTLEAVVSALHLRMEEVFEREAKVAEVIRRIYERAKLNWDVRELNGTVLAIKDDGTPIIVQKPSLLN
jgi:transcriptional regulator with XRE-family HTH domain